jgi:hypothetical protein
MKLKKDAENYIANSLDVEAKRLIAELLTRYERLVDTQRAAVEVSVVDKGKLN